MQPDQGERVVFPPGWTRTADHARQRSQFKVSFAGARDDLLRELVRMDAADVRLVVAGELRQDGLPYANARQPADPGVVVYWSKGGRKYAMACDKWNDRGSNMRSIALTLKAKRDMARWGATTDEAEYKGYEALPPPSGEATLRSFSVLAPHEVLGVRVGAHKAEVEAAFCRLAHQHHPDKGGDRAAWDRIVEARAALLGGDAPR